MMENVLTLPLIVSVLVKEEVLHPEYLLHQIPLLILAVHQTFQSFVETVVAKLVNPNVQSSQAVTLYLCLIDVGMELVLIIQPLAQLQRLAFLVQDVKMVSAEVTV